MAPHETKGFNHDRFEAQVVGILNTWGSFAVESRYTRIECSASDMAVTVGNAP